MNKRKKRFYLFFFVSTVFSVLLLVSFTSAGLIDWYNKITGKATSATTALNITVGSNNAPTVSFVSVISATDPSVGTTKNISFTFNATDIDGYTNLNNSAAWAQFSKSGETTRTNTSCVAINNNGINTTQYNCTVRMYYWDGAGSWTINASIRDVNNVYADNTSTTFTYNTAQGMVMSPTSLTWPSVNTTFSNIGSNNDPVTVNNTGNDVDLTLNITGYDLRGETTTTQFIYADNFTISGTSEGCGGTEMLNATSLNVTSTILQIGNNTKNFGNATSGQEQMFFCLEGVLSSISAQSYSSSAYGSWNVQII